MWSMENAEHGKCREWKMWSTSQVLPRNRRKMHHTPLFFFILHIFHTPHLPHSALIFYPTYANRSDQTEPRFDNQHLSKDAANTKNNQIVPVRITNELRTSEQPMDSITQLLLRYKPYLYINSIQRKQRCVVTKTRVIPPTDTPLERLLSDEPDENDEPSAL